MYKTTLFIACLLCNQYASATTLSYQQAIKQALNNDKQSQALAVQQQAWQQGANAVAFLPKPQISLGLMNASADGLDLNQQAMTQQQLKYSQKLPQSGAQVLKKSQATLKQQTKQLEWQERQAWLTYQVGLLWLDAHKQQSLLALYKQQQQLFEQTAEVVLAQYQSGQPNTQQADVLEAQLAVSIAQQKIIEAKQKQQHALLGLNAWLPQTFEQVSGPLPQFEKQQKSNIRKHPKIMALQAQIEQAELTTEIKQLSKKPQWGLSAAYGHRKRDEMGQPREDLISLAVSFDLPWINKKHQDAGVSQAALEADAAVHNWQQAISNMQAELAATSQLATLSETLYQNHQNRLVAQSELMASAQLKAYQSGTSSLNELLNAQQTTLALKSQAIKYLHQWKAHLMKIQYLQSQTNTAKPRSGEQP